MRPKLKTTETYQMTNNAHSAPKDNVDHIITRTTSIRVPGVVSIDNSERALFSCSGNEIKRVNGDGDERKEKVAMMTTSADSGVAMANGAKGFGRVRWSPCAAHADWKGTQTMIASDCVCAPRAVAGIPVLRRSMSPQHLPLSG